MKSPFNLSMVTSVACLFSVYRNIGGNILNKSQFVEQEVDSVCHPIVICYIRLCQVGVINIIIAGGIYEYAADQGDCEGTWG